MNIIFFGTHNFAASMLEGLIRSSFVNVVCVFTQPDRSVGRKQTLETPPVKILAEEYHIPVEQAKSLKNNFQFPKYKAHLHIVAQYGLIIPKHIIDAPQYGTINVHTSLLPKYRGASPIQSAIMQGETETGVTIMKMDEGLDTGPILSQQTIRIGPDDICTTVEKNLIDAAVPLLRKTMEGYISGTIEPIPQDNTLATVCTKLSRDDGKIDWTTSSKEIYNRYRGLTPWPGVWTEWRGRRLKLLSVRPSSKKAPCGQLYREGDALMIGCADGSLEIRMLQMEGKKPMTAKEWINGFRSLLLHS